MANSAEGGESRRVMTPDAFAFSPKLRGASVRRWFQLWRWPAALIAGIVLWLALVAVAGAAMASGDPPFIGHEPSRVADGSMPTPSQVIADKAQ